MKLNQFKEDADYYSGKASEINRQLSLAGIAIVWLFKITKNEHISLPDDLKIVTFFFALSLLLELLQYVVGYIIWSRFHRKKELAGFKSEDEVLANNSNKYPINILFYAKILLNFIAYFLLTGYLFWQIF